MMTDFPPVLAAFVRHERSRIELAWHEARHAIAGILNGGTLTSSTITEGKVKRGMVGQPSGATTFASLSVSRHAQVALSLIHI